MPLFGVNTWVLSYNIQPNIESFTQKNKLNKRKLK